MGPASTHACHAARQQVSAQLDGELDQLGRVRLRAHLARCAECRRFAGELKSITVRLRREELEPVPARAYSEWRSHVKLVASAVGTLAAASVIAIAVAHPTGSRADGPPLSQGFQWHSDPSAYNHTTHMT